MIPSRIIAFGSSSVKGRGDPDEGGFVGRLGKWHQSLSASNSTINLGLIGDSTLKMIDRFNSEVPGHQPGLIILYPGLNDCRRKTQSDPPALSDNKFRQNLIALLERSLSLAPTIFISSFPIDETRTSPWKESKQFYLFADAARFTAIGREICQDMHVTYVPIFETWSERPDFVALSLDGLHGTPDAHELLARELREVICGTFE